MQARQAALLHAVEDLLPALQAQAAELDAAAAFPQAAFQRLIEIGALKATLPEHLGGLGFGYGADGAVALNQLLQLLGEANLAVARLYEAHVNALQLILRYGSESIARQTALDAAREHIFALWVTDPAGSQVRLEPDGPNYTLQGAKAFCSGAGTATRALITAATPTGIRMLVVALEPQSRVLPSQIKLSGMRAAVTGSIDLTGLTVTRDALLGAAGDYLREPVFSAGAWRGAAAALGGLTALIKLHRNEIVSRRRDADPHQRARFGEVVMAYETARLWTARAALRGCLEDAEPAAIVAYINLARLAVEAACLSAMRHTQRGLGLSAFMAGHPVERLCRDLATYLRQPAPDEALEKAAAYYLRAPLPPEP